MNELDVLELLGHLRAAGVRVWLDGGWGIDALLGQVSRPHADVDLVVELAALARVGQVLGVAGFELTEDLTPTRQVWRVGDGRQVDLHPVTFDAHGTGWQAGAGADGGDCPYPASEFCRGLIAGQVVPCISAALQRIHHGGYTPRAHDRADMARLGQRFGLAPPDGY